MIHLGDRSNHWCPIWEINSKFEYERNNESNDDLTPLLDQRGSNAPRWGWRIFTASGACKVGRSGGWCKMINSKVIPFWNLLVFSLPPIHIYIWLLKSLWFKLLHLHLLTLVKTRTSALHVTFHMTFTIQLNLRSWVNKAPLQGLSKSTTFWSAKSP